MMFGVFSLGVVCGIALVTCVAAYIDQGPPVSLLDTGDDRRDDHKIRVEL